MTKQEKAILEQERKQALRAAKDLFYSEECREKIRNANSVEEITRALKTERIRE